ncbi:glycosyltransferase family A protein [Clavibacter tessellarius]|uniref:glycosyltransferase family A protein n=1 Tax=Clavibacter tessellarius TaxID=31965 RepID=UPI00324E3A36
MDLSLQGRGGRRAPARRGGGRGRARRGRHAERRPRERGAGQVGHVLLPQRPEPAPLRGAPPRRRGAPPVAAAHPRDRVRGAAAGRAPAVRAPGRACDGRRARDRRRVPALRRLARGAVARADGRSGRIRRCDRVRVAVRVRRGGVRARLLARRRDPHLPPARRHPRRAPPRRRAGGRPPRGRRGRPRAPRAVRIVVVDNDPAGGAGAAVEDAAAASAVPIAYVHEPTPGISAARNRALDAAGDDDLLVFLDDDERPDPGWLAALVRARQATGSAGVAGPVRSEYEVEPDAWVRAGGFFVRRRPATGTRLEVAATNNLLLDLRAVRAAGLRFDVDLGTQGGEDTLFTRQLVASGGLLTWCAEAGVVDVVPRARTTRRWVVLRAFSSGNSWSLTSVALAPASPAARARIRAEATARGLVRALGGTGRIAVGAATSSVAHRAKGTRTLARGAGMVAGAFGWSYQEYARRD